jgi:hypothetical protein
VPPSDPVFRVTFGLTGRDQPSGGPGLAQSDTFKAQADPTDFRTGHPGSIGSELAHHQGLIKGETPWILNRIRRSLSVSG